jgi:nicotinamide mononucleotide transporter
VDNPLEIAAVVFILVNVALTALESIWSWPVGAVGVILYLIVFFQANLYASAGLQIVFLVIILYGWYAWLHGGEDQGALRVSRTPAVQWPALIAAGVAMTFGVGWIISKMEAALPYWDAAIAGFSLVAQWMQARKQIEHWFLWMLVDIVAVITYWMRGLRFSAGLYVVLFGLCCWGFVQWRRSLAASA